MTLKTIQATKPLELAKDRLSLGDEEHCWQLIAGKTIDSDGHRPPFVSLVITAYNYEKFIAECLRSVRQQTYTHFECLVVDDRSRDATRAVAEATIEAWDDPRFAVVTPEKNLGQLGAQIYGFARTTGQFVVFVDADDVLRPNFLERHVFAHLHMPVPVAFTSSDQWHIDAEGRVLSFHHPDLFSGTKAGEGSHVVIQAGDQDAEAMKCVIFGNCGLGRGFGPWWWATQSTMMFRRGILDLVLPAAADASKYRICADFYLVRFSQLLTNSALLCEQLGSYRRHGQNNFCSNPLAANLPVGDMRKHPTLESFYALASGVLQSRKEAFIGVLGEQGYNNLSANFHHNLTKLAGPLGLRALLKKR